MMETSNDTAITVGHVQLRPAISLTPASTVAECARIAARTDSELLVVESRPITIVSRDSLARAIVAGIDPDTTVVAVATAPTYAPAHGALLDAVRAMAAECIAAVLVVDDDGALTGVLSLADAVATLLTGPQWLGALRVALHIEATS
jgi:CBS domain-containing protein